MVAFAHQIQAQITITAANSYQVGDLFTTQSCSPTSVTLSASGPNVSANFASAVDVNTPVVTTFISPVGTPYASSFPTATACLIVGTSMGNTGYTYYKIDATGIELLGVGTQAYVLVYANPQQALKYPLAYTDTYTDLFEGGYTANGYDIHRAGRIDVTADAHGTITTPSGTFQYLRLKMVQAISDTIFLDGDVVSVQLQTTTTYNYMSNTRKNAVFSYSEIFTGSNSTVIASYDKSNNTSVNAANGMNTQIELYPNPFNEQFALSVQSHIPESLTINIYDTNGKLIHHQKVAADGNRKEVPLQTAAWNPGMYFLSLEGEQTGKIERQKLVKQ